LANLAVQMSGAGPALVRWSAAPSGEAPEGQLLLLGDRQSARLFMPADEKRWRWEVGGEAFGPQQYDSFNGPRAALESFAKKIRRNDRKPDPLFHWAHACRACELAEAAERSVTRGRTIELHLETHSEEETFKGLMAAGGCLLVIAALFGLFIASLIGGFQLPSIAEREANPKPEDAPSLSLWLRIWPVYPLLLFLALQLLRLVFRKKSS
jgi:hypothetical protein